MDFCSFYICRLIKTILKIINLKQQQLQNSSESAINL